MSDAEAGGDTNESECMGEESDERVPCEEFVALSKESVLDELRRTKYKEVSRA